MFPNFQPQISIFPRQFLNFLVFLAHVRQTDELSLFTLFCFVLLYIFFYILSNVCFLPLLSSTGNTATCKTKLCSQSFPPLLQPLPPSPADSIVVTQFLALFDSSACHHFNTFSIVDPGQIWKARVVDEGTCVVESCPKRSETPTSLTYDKQM